MNESTAPSPKIPIVVESTLTRSTYIKLNLIPIFKTKGFCICIVILAAATYFLHALDLYVISFFIWGIFSFSVAAVIVFILFLAFSTQNFAFFLPTQCTFDEEKITAQTELTQSTATWNAVVDWKIIKDHYVLFFSTLTFIAIPRDSFPPGSIPRFEKLLRNIQKISYAQPIAIETTLSKTTYVMLWLLLFFFNLSFFLLIALYIVIPRFLAPAGFFRLLLMVAVGVYVAFAIMSTGWYAFSQKNKTLFLPTHYTFDEEKIVVRTESAQTTIQWGTFTAWRGILGYFVLFLSSRKVIVIPRSKIPAQASSAFEWLLRDKIGWKLLVWW